MYEKLEHESKVENHAVFLSAAAGGARIAVRTFRMKSARPHGDDCTAIPGLAQPPTRAAHNGMHWDVVIRGWNPYHTAHVYRVVLRWNCAKVIANIDNLAISIWAPKVIDELSQIDVISSPMPGQRIVDIGVKISSI